MKTPLFFRPARPDEASEILEIHRSHSDRKSQKGFLLSQPSIDAIKTRIADSEPSLFVAANPTGEVVGFVEITDHVEAEVWDHLDWVNETWRRVFTHNEMRQISKVAVKQAHLKTGVGSYLYQSVLEKWGEFPLCAFVAVKPVCNGASVQFHRGFAFTKVASFKARDFFGMRNYESIMFGKAPSLRP